MMELKATVKVPECWVVLDKAATERYGYYVSLYIPLLVKLESLEFKHYRSTCTCSIRFAHIVKKQMQRPVRNLQKIMLRTDITFSHFVKSGLF